MSLRSVFRGPLFPKPVTGQELFLAVSYSKPALIFIHFCKLFMYKFLTFTGMQIRHSKRSANAKLAKNTFVGLFIFLYPRMATRISRLPIIPKRRVKLKWKNTFAFTNWILHFNIFFFIKSNFQPISSSSFFKETFTTRGIIAK